MVVKEIVVESDRLVVVTPGTGVVALLIVQITEQAVEMPFSRFN